MSYLHCPACSRAYNLATHPSCPCCSAIAVARTLAPADNLAAALATLTSALAQASSAERAGVAMHIEQLAGPAHAAPAGDLAGPPAHADPDHPVSGAADPRGADHRDHRGPAPRAIRTALTVASPRAGSRSRPLVAAVAFAVLDRLASHAPRRLLRAVHAGVQAFRA